MRFMNQIRLPIATVLVFTVCTTLAAAEPPFIPRRQDKPPGPPLSPEQAIEKMTVPEGFSDDVRRTRPRLDH